jgi:hypothetical protein
MRPSRLPIAAAVGFVLDDFVVGESNESFSLQPLAPSMQGFWSVKPWVEQVRVQGSLLPVTPSPQSILLSPGQERMIRIQDDLIAYNWRKMPNLEYIGYDTIADELQRLLTSVSNGVEKLSGHEGSALILLSGIELLYVDKFQLAAASLLNPFYDPVRDRLQATVSTIDMTDLSDPKFDRVLWSLDLSTGTHAASLDLDLMQRISVENTLVTLVSRYKAEGHLQDWRDSAALLDTGHVELIKRFREFIPEEVQREWE